jgi:hypothetical protein
MYRAGRRKRKKKKEKEEERERRRKRRESRKDGQYVYGRGEQITSDR